MTGVEVLRQAKAIRPETTRLLFTAYIDIRTVIDAINQGHVFRYIAKPCDPERALGRRAAGRRAARSDRREEPAWWPSSKRATPGLLEANRLKGAFIEVASHELNTPVTVVLGMIDLWKMSQGPSASPSRAPVGRTDRRRGRPAGPDGREDAQAGTESGLQPVARHASRSSWGRSCGRRSTSSPPISSCAARPCRCRSSPSWACSRPTRPRSPTC